MKAASASRRWEGDLAANRFSPSRSLRIRRSCRRGMEWRPSHRARQMREGRTGLIVDGQTLWAGERNEERRELREETYAWRGRGTQSFGPPNIFVSSRRTSLSSLRSSRQSQCHIEKSFSRTIWPNLDLPGSWRRTRRQNPGLRSHLVRRLLVSHKSLTMNLCLIPITV